MKQKIQLQVAEPCHENWNSMTDTREGRFCSSCRKEVIDFSLMTDKEILNYISTASNSSICGRMANDQLNRNLLAPPEPRKRWWKYWMGIAASFILLSSRSTAQEKSKPAIVCSPHDNKKNRPVSIRMGAIAYVQDNRAKVAIKGKVLNNQNNPIPYATISIKENQIGVAADTSGNFVLNTSAELPGIELIVSSVGYQSKTIKITAEELKAATAKDNILFVNVNNIILESQLMNELVVTGYRTQGLLITVGAVSVCRRSTRLEKAKSRIKEVLGTNEIKIYPNPVAVNGRFAVCLNVKDQGEYAVQFIDVSGKIIYGKQLNVLSKNHTESFDGGIFPGTGIYFVHLKAKQSGKVYSNKLLVQY